MRDLFGRRSNYTRATSSILSFSGLRKSDRPKRSPVKEDGEPPVTEELFIVEKKKQEEPPAKESRKQKIAAKKEGLNGFRGKELKSICDDAKVSVVGLFEKSEIVDTLARSVMQKETGKAKEPAQVYDPTYKDAVAMVDREKQEEILVVAEESLSSMVEENRQDELIIEEKKQEESSANEALMVDGEKQEEIPVVAEESPMVEENRQDELPPVEKSNNNDAEKNILFQLIYSLHIYFDNTELDEVIKHLSSCGPPHYESEKLVSRNISVTGDTSGSDAAPTSDSDDAVVFKDLNKSPRVLVYEENRINFIDECFDTLDGVEYCSAVVNTACNPCTSLLNVQDHMENEMKERKHTVVNVFTTAKDLAEE